MMVSDHGVRYIERPYSRYEIEQMQSTSRTFTANVKVSLETLWEGREATDDYVSQAVTGGPWFQFEGEAIVDSIQPSWVILSVTGYVEDGDLEYMG